MASPMLVRARDAQGRFVADDPSTPDVDEALVLATAQDNDTNGGVTV